MYNESLDIFDQQYNSEKLDNTLTETLQPLGDILSVKHPSIGFTYKMFKKYPHLFRSHALVMMYAQYNGMKYKPDIIYNIFEQFVKCSDSNIMNLKKNDMFTFDKLINTDIDIVITWARTMKEMKSSYVFEPIMEKLNTTFNTWSNIGDVEIFGSLYNFNDLEPICYSCSGENIHSLIPYFCYIITFLVHCSPFSFDEGQSETSMFGFCKSLDEWYTLNYDMLGKDYGIEIVESSLDALDSIPDSQWDSFLTKMLNVDKIISIRNTEISKTPSLLQECIESQYSLSQDHVNRSWGHTMSILLEIVINMNPLKKLYNTIPRFNRNSVDTHEIMMMTQYAMTPNPFICIREDPVSNTFSYQYSANQNPMKYPFEMFNNINVTSGINKLRLSKGIPFSCADPILEMAIGYLRGEFIAKINDPLDDDQIFVDETYLDKYSDDISSFFVSGYWMLNNCSLSSALSLLFNMNNAKIEMLDLWKLKTLCEQFYDNCFANSIIIPLLYSFLPEWILEHCESKYPIRGFSPFVYLSSIDVKCQSVVNRINKLCDIATSLMFLKNQTYVKFVNNTMIRFEELITAQNTNIHKVFVKGLMDYADVYAIGGCELYNYAALQNPLMRGCGFIFNTFGNCESLETFYAWISLLTNEALFNVISESLSNVDMIQSSLKTQWGKLFSSKKRPQLLSNFEFSDVDYKYRNYPAFLLGSIPGLNDSNVLDAVCKYTFPMSSAASSMRRKIYTMNIDYNKRTGKILSVNQPIFNEIRWGTISTPIRLLDTINQIDPAMDDRINKKGSKTFRIPVYDFRGKVEDTDIIFTSPNGMKCEEITTYSTRGFENQTFWIFNDRPVTTRFQKYMI